MDYVQLGATDLKVSRIGLGCMSFGSDAWRPWILNPKESRVLLHRALDLGINFFDTANVYSHGRGEKLVGQFIKESFRRDDVVISTKIGYPGGKDPSLMGLSRNNILSAIDHALTRLQTDYVDILQIHLWDPDTAIEETMEALHHIVEAGKVRYLGATNLRAWQLGKAHFTAKLSHWTGFSSMQVHYNLLHREDERDLIPLCMDQGIAVLPWSPLARGRLARAGMPRPQHESPRAVVDDVADTLYGVGQDPILADLASLAKRKEKSPAQLAIAWLLQAPGVTAPLIGATQLHHIDEAVSAVDMVLTPEEVAALERCYTPRALSELPGIPDHQSNIWDLDD